MDGLCNAVGVAFDWLLRTGSAACWFGEMALVRQRPVLVMDPTLALQG